MSDLPSSLDAAELVPLVYNELRKLAAARMAGEPDGHTLDGTALVHEAYLRLGGEHVERAMELLQIAVKAGYKDAAHMPKDADLDRSVAGMTSRRSLRCLRISRSRTKPRMRLRLNGSAGLLAAVRVVESLSDSNWGRSSIG